MDPVEDFLLHYGVKGMKWGVRKARQDRQDNAGKGKTATDKKIKKLDKRFERQAKSLGVFIDVHNEAARTYNAMDVGRINNSAKYKNLDFNKPSKLRDQYEKEHADAFLKRLESAAAAQGTNASGTRKLKIDVRDEGNGITTWGVSTVDVKHADANPDMLVFRPVLNDKGQIVDVELVEDQMAQSITADEFLAHYGIKGMKWGVRRKRGADGLVEKSQDVKDAEAARAKVTKKGSTEALSNKELQALVTRMNLEQQFSKLSGDAQKSNVSKGKKFVQEVLSVGRTVNDVISFVNSPAGKLVKEQLKK